MKASEHKAGADSGKGRVGLTGEDSGNPLVQKFASRLRAWRRKQGKPLKEVAADLGVSIAIVSEWEHGHRFPSVKHLQSVTRYTGISASDFFSDFSLAGNGGCDKYQTRTGRFQGFRGARELDGPGRKRLY
jgi:transcriptional regulator with XRE-family HTH domain